ncbi:hypothetical protein [Aerococcus viridans]|nr:hypothetical protein [Aerococcus viridans]
MKNDPNSILTSTVITIMKIQDYINKGELIISDKILEQRYEYDVDKTVAEVKEILNGDDPDSLSGSSFVGSVTLFFICSV